MFVINRYRGTNTNLRTQLNRIIRRAGLEPWPKLFQNLRSTRETELAEEYPIHVVCEWIGNSKAIASKHYLQVTDDHFRRATQKPTQTGPDTEVSASPRPTSHTPESLVGKSGHMETVEKVAEAGNGLSTTKAQLRALHS